MLITPREIISAENAWLANGGDADELIEVAGEGIARSVQGFFPANHPPGTMLLALGPGNNAGDACVLARIFAAGGWTIRYVIAIPERPLSKLTQANLEKINGKIAPLDTPGYAVSDTLPRPLLLVDGLLGTGSRLPLEGRILDCARWLNRCRRENNGFTIAIDLPSGLDGTTGEPSPDTVVANLTTTIFRAKPGLLADSATDFVGRLAIIPLPQLHVETVTEERVFRPEAAHRFFHQPPHTAHKTKVGRVLVLGGSPGMSGAAVLSAKAALRTGAGLVTLMTDPRCLGEVAFRSPPEIMVRPLGESHDIAWDQFDALCIGPGLGQNLDRQILEILQHCPLPVTIDADALNAIARAPAHRREQLLSSPAAPRLITPHHGELLRLFPPAKNNKTRAGIARAFIERFPDAVLVYKGARTIVASKQQANVHLWYNPTGHVGMATAGMGDSLSGICATFLSRGFDARLSGSAAAWLHGRAAEIATFSHYPRTAVDSLTACDLIDHIGSAIIDLREHITY